MAKTIANVSVSTDNFDAWVTKTNQALNFITNEAISANAGTGSTTGNAQLIGIFSANTIVVNTNLRGGNVSTSGLLTVSSNLVASGTANITGAAALANSLAVTGLSTLSGNLNTTVANASVSMSVGANITINTSVIQIGNSTVNNYSNSSGIWAPSADFLTQVTLGSNVTITPARFHVGNSTVNTFITATAIDTDGTLTATGAAVLSNTLSVTGNTVLSNTLYVTGNTVLSGTANVTGLASVGNLNTTTANATTSIYVGGNVSINTSVLSIGNSTVNSYISAANIHTDGGLTVENASLLSNTLQVDGLASLNAGLNTTTANASTKINVGANMSVNTTTIYIGNATVNSIHTVSYLQISNSLITSNLTNIDLKIGNSTVNSIINSSSVGIGANIAVNTSVIFIGNSTVNTTLSSSGITTNGTIAVTGSATLSNTLTVTGLGTFNGALNTTTANASVGMNIGANITINTSVIQIGNSTVNNYSNSSGIWAPSADFLTQVTLGSNVTITPARFHVGNSTVNTFITATAVSTDGTLTIGGNAVFEGTLNQFAGNNNFDSGVLFVDATNNRVGVNNTSPDASLTVTGTANVSGAAVIAGLTTLSGNVNTTTANASVALNVGTNVNLTTSRINVGNSTVNTFVTSTTVETDGTVVLGPGSVYRSSNTASTSSTTETIVDSYPKTEGNFARYVVGIRDSGATVLHTLELMAIHNGSTVFLSKYGEIFNTASLGTFDAVINNANVELKFTAANNTAFTIKTSRVHM